MTNLSVLESKAGIYQIENVKNHKRYIGLSKNVRERCLDHLSNLSGNKHRNDYLQKAWNADPCAFSISVIEYCDLSELEEREIFWIQFYNTTDESLGYNHTGGGNHYHGENAPWWGKRHSKETIAKMSVSARNRTTNHLPKSEAFVAHLREIMRGSGNPFYGKHHTEETRETLRRYTKERWNNENFKSKILHPVVQLALNGSFVAEFSGVTDASKSVNRSYTTLSGACSGKQKTCAGYKWMYEEDYKKMFPDRVVGD